MSNATNYNFISNNVKGIRIFKKRLKLFEYLKQNMNSNGFILFQETHSSLNEEKQWKDEFNGRLFFSHGKTNSYGVATEFCGKNSFDLIDEDNFIIINIYNSNTKSKQLKTFSILQYMLDDIEISNKQVILVDDFNLIFDCKLALNTLQDFVKKSDVSASFSTDHSPIFFSFEKGTGSVCGTGL